MSEVVLTVNGEEFSNWTTVELRDGFNEIPSFSIGFTRPLPDDPAAIQEGDECTVKVDGELVITGYVDATTEGYDDGQHQLSVEGRAKTGDLVDCTAIYGGSSITKTKAEEVVRIICKPFGIAVEVDPILYRDTAFSKPIDKVKLEQGAPAWEAITEVLRRKTLMAITKADGNLLLTRASKDAIPGIAFERGVNIKSASRRGDATRLHSEYTFKAQKSGDDSTNGKDSSHLKGVLKETSVKRYRPLVILAEYPGSNEDLGKRAIWERNTRHAQAEKIDITVRGWTLPADNVSLDFDPNAATLITGASRSRASQGNVISINSLLRYRDGFFGYDDDMLIEHRVLRKDLDGGSIAQISLVGREAYDLLEPPPPRKGRKKKKTFP